MRKAKIYIMSGLTVAGVGIVLRFAQTAYNVYIAGKLGAEGMGMLSLVTSVWALAVTFASSGVGLTCTRTVSEALGLQNYREARRSLRGCVVYSLLFGFAAFLLLYFLSEPIGRQVLDSERAAACLRTLSFALPAVSLSSCFSGCFAAMRRAHKTSVVQIIEQGARILLTALFFAHFSVQGKDVEAVLYAACLSEALTFLLLLALVLIDAKKQLSGGGEVSEGLLSRVFSISLPIAVTAWVRAALVSAEHVLIPRGLRLYGEQSALGTYGIMHGMALPVVFFPYAVLTPFTQLLIPEFARFKAANSDKDVSFTASLCLRLTMLFAFGCSAFLCAFGEELGTLLYHTEGVGRNVALFALLIPVMYLDTSVDAVLKGLGEQFWCMLVNIGDAALSLLLVFLLVPRMGAAGYLLTVFAAECFNTAFSFLRLRKKVRLSLSPFSSLVMPAACAFISALAAKAATVRASLPELPRVLVAAVIFLCLYALLVVLTGAFKKSDRRYFARLIKGK